MRKPLYLHCMAVFSGVLIGTSQMPFPAWALFFALVPLWLTWLADPYPWRVFIRGMITLSVASIIGMYWLAYAAYQYGHFSLLTSIIILCIYCAFISLAYALAGLTWSLLYKKINFTNNQSLFLFACLCFLYETYFPNLIPWNMGYPWLWSNLYGYQWADYIGFVGLSFATFLINSIIAIIWIRRRDKKPYRLLSIILVVLFAGIHLSGYWHGLKFKELRQNIPLKVLIVQANIDKNEKIRSEKVKESQINVINTYINLTVEALKKYPDTTLVVWPESAIPIIFSRNSPSNPTVKSLFNFIRSSNKTFIFGTYYKDANNKKYNAALLVDRKGNIIGNYYKTLLFTFGEYIPGATLFPALKRLLPEISDFSVGMTPRVLNLDQYRFGMQICYEGMYPYISQLLSLKGANIFINLTNDSWFGGWSEAKQHLTATIGRAVEFRIPLVRSTNTGISTVAQANGSYTVASPYGESWYYQYTAWMPHKNPLTFYARFGHLVPYTVLLITALIIAIISCRQLFKN